MKTDFASTFTAVHGMNTAHTDTLPHYNFLVLRYSGQITKFALLRLELPAYSPPRFTLVNLPVDVPRPSTSLIL